jgi:hypothetical protein
MVVINGHKDPRTGQGWSGPMTRKTTPLKGAVLFFMLR